MKSLSEELLTLYQYVDFARMLFGAFQPCETCRRFPCMSALRKTRAIVALAAAYAVAAQAVLLAVGVPIGGTTDFAASSLCSASQTGVPHPAPGGKDHDCPAACGACCCGAPVVTPSAAAVVVSYAQVVAGSIADVSANRPTWRFSLDRAHRSRAPPHG
jgi:hypothetical protein